MKVSELIEKLKELNPNLPVYFGVSDTWFWSADCLEVCDPDNFGEDVCLIYHQVVEMKVKELINKLKTLDQERTITIYNDINERAWNIDDIEKWDEYYVLVNK